MKNERDARKERIMLQFVFLVHERDTRPLKGYEKEMTGTVHIARSLPGNVVASGGTEKEAVKNLQMLITGRMQRSGDPKSWYANALEATDKELYQRFMNKLFSISTEKRAVVNSCSSDEQFSVLTVRESQGDGLSVDLLGA